MPDIKTLTRSKLFWAASVLIITTIIGGIYWKRITLEIKSHIAAKNFEQEFTLNKGAYVCKHNTDWAIAFGGTIGLKRLNALGHNANISPNGRKLALEIYNYISCGDHLTDMKPIKDAYHGANNGIESPEWPMNELTIYIYERDKLIIKKSP